MRELEDAVRFVEEMDREIGKGARAVPGRVRATDRTGMITAVLGPTGRPESFDVDEDWLRHLGSESFGSAVAEACRAALTRRGELLAGAPPSPHEAGADEPPPAPPVRDLTVEPRPIGAVLADLADLIGTPVGEPGYEPEVGTARSYPGRITLTLRHDGTVHCDADPHRVAERAGADLTDELNRLLGAAADDLAAQTDRLTERIEGIRTEAWALIIGPYHTRRADHRPTAEERQ